MTAGCEVAATINVEGDEVLAILHEGAPGARVGVLVVVGGPQYRVGSHRQFVLLARRLAAEGYPVLRFDYRGRGDSAGPLRDFEDVADDIAAALDFLVASTGVERVVLWGLCDAASAILMHAGNSPRIAGMVLLNPWVHSVATEARARLKTYYGARLCNPEFWRKIVRLEVDWRDSLRSLFGYLRGGFGRRLASANAAGSDSETSFIERMLGGWARSGAPSLLILSGDDITAAEFRELVKADAAWREQAARNDVVVFEMPEANHTFARAEWRQAVEDATLRWLRRHFD